MSEPRLEPLARLGPLARATIQFWDNTGYHRQGTVENAFFRYKSITGDRLRARHSKAQEAETLIACNILNEMTALGRPASYAIGAR